MMHIYGLLFIGVFVVAIATPLIIWQIRENKRNEQQ